MNGHDAEAYWGVALTRRGKIAVYMAHCNDRWPAELEIYDTLDQAAEHRVPAGVIAQASAALGSVVQLDI